MTVDGSPFSEKATRVNNGLSGEKTCAAQPSEFVDIFIGYPNEFENFSILDISALGGEQPFAPTSRI